MIEGTTPTWARRTIRYLDCFLITILLGLLLAQIADAKDSELIGGTPADAAKWPVSVYARMDGAACSATVVGERVLLIAAHCVDDGGTASFTVGGSQYRSTCTHHPAYTGQIDPALNSTADWALCLVDRKVVGGPYEVLVQEGDWCRAGAKVRLTGYGCVRNGGGGGNDGVFRIGEASVTSCPSGARNFDVVTRGGAALCYGDSGGAAYLEFSDGTRKIFGVNSRGNIRDTSYLSAVFVEPAKDWMGTWAAAKGVEICGVTSKAVGCAGPAVPPPVPQELPLEVKASRGAEVAVQVRPIAGRKCRWATGEKGCRIWVKPAAPTEYVLTILDESQEAKVETVKVVPQ